jgi:hypothetical protein
VVLIRANKRCSCASELGNGILGGKKSQSLRRPFVPKGTGEVARPPGEDWKLGEVGKLAAPLR